MNKEYDEMTEEELQDRVVMAEYEYESLKDTIHDLYDENKDLKEKIDKAIECLNYYTCNKEFLSVEEQELYEILKGE